ncbi:MAG TPA: hypothetical protein VF681_04375, partial [Abditibacteriaceae bacterium]
MRKFGWLVFVALGVCPMSAQSKSKTPNVPKASEPPVPAKWDRTLWFHRGGQFRRYDGNPNWNPRVVYTSDSELGTPSHLSQPHYGPWVDVEGRRVRVVTR